MQPAQRAFGTSAEEAQAAIERFLKSSREPALLEPGEELLLLTADNFIVESRASGLTLQAWDHRRNLVRRLTGVREETRGRLELLVELFAGREGRLFLIDMARPEACHWRQRGSRLVFRERFRQILGRQFPGWRMAELSAEANLEQSLSPVYPRALLKKGRSGYAAIAAAPGDANASGILSFGLIWLDYLRRREPRSRIEGLAVFVPCGQERTTSLRLRFLDANTAQFDLFHYSEQDYAARVDAADCGNLDTVLQTRRQCAPLPAALNDLALDPVENGDGSTSLRVRGVEIARGRENDFVFGLETKRPLHEHNFGELECLASEMRRFRSASGRESPLYRMQPEVWLESQARSDIETLDAFLLPSPVYGQVPAFAGGDRGVMDLLAVERSGRLAVLELKTEADLHLPLQALDYWMRVAWHARNDEFAGRGYFPGVRLQRESPRLLLVAPALQFHPTTETILRFFSPAVQVERIGVNLDWRQKLEVMFRFSGGSGPD